MCALSALSGHNSAAIITFNVAGDGDAPTALCQAPCHVYLSVAYLSTWHGSLRIFYCSTTRGTLAKAHVEESTNPFHPFLPVCHSCPLFRRICVLELGPECGPRPRFFSAAPSPVAGVESVFTVTFSPGVRMHGGDPQVGASMPPN